MLVNVDSLPSTSSQAIEHYLVLIVLYMCVDYVFYSNVNYAFSFFFVLQASISLDKECTLLKLQNGQQKNQITKLTSLFLFILSGNNKNSINYYFYYL